MSVPIQGLAIGGGAVAVIGAVGGLLRGRRRRLRIDDEDTAMAGAGAALPGFAPRAAVIGHDGGAALVNGTGSDGGEQLVVLRAGGRRLEARAVDWGAVRAAPGGIVVETGVRRLDGSTGGVPLVGIDALDVRRLAPAASQEAIRVAAMLALPPDDSTVVTKAACR